MTKFFFKACLKFIYCTRWPLIWSFTCCSIFCFHVFRVIVLNILPFGKDIPCNSVLKTCKERSGRAGISDSTHDAKSVTDASEIYQVDHMLLRFIENSLVFRRETCEVIYICITTFE